jgi:hypothetical protein
MVKHKHATIKLRTMQRCHSKPILDHRIVFGGRTLERRHTKLILGRGIVSRHGGGAKRRMNPLKC